jgi:hypothetical protein
MLSALAPRCVSATYLPLLTNPRIHPLKPVASLFQPPKPSVSLGRRCRNIYPVQGPTVKGILADVEC